MARKRSPSTGTTSGRSRCAVSGSSIGYVSQEPFLFTGTIRENVAYGLDVTDEAVYEVAEQANAHGFITDMEDGYDTEVGQRGDRLSGGNASGSPSHGYSCAIPRY